jgi:hypothetical protein
MNTIVGIMDRAGYAANTDVLVLVEPEREWLLWVPRDLWCPKLGNRINTAYKSGGHARLVAALAEHELEAQHSLIFAREATESALAGARVVVPVPAPMIFDYPLTPTARIEDGRKTITFKPPAEILMGERIHQWLGARGGSDLHRLERQKVFVRRLLEQGFDFRRFIANPDWYTVSDPAALEALARVRPSWKFETLGGLTPTLIGDKDVLVRS